MDRLATESWAARAMFVKWGLVFLKATVLVERADIAIMQESSAPSAQSECVINLTKVAKRI
jgi:hypothetical protein